MESKTQSVWLDAFHPRKRDSLQGDIQTDVVVIGGGMAGILTAYLLQEQGMEVVVIEASSIASGVTKNTTAKITAQHNVICHKLIGSFGMDKAEQYMRANSYAIEKFEEIIKQKNIDCDFERKPSYVFTLDDAHTLMFEANAANKLGIPAQFTKDTSLPFAIAGAVKFPNQAQFHPLKFLEAIAEDLTIYENTMAKSIEDNRVITEHGEIKAKKIVMATHYPFINAPGYYFARMHQERSYVIALENAADLDGMYIDADENGYSFRNYKNLLLFGGAGHRTGDNFTGGRYKILRNAAKKLYPDSEERYHWSTQDCMSLDGAPYIGQYSSSTPDLYVATGFNKWGMTSSMTAAIILTDLLQRKTNENQEVFSAKRFHLATTANNLFQEGVQAVSGLFSEKLRGAKFPAADIENGHGGIVEYEGHKVGIYKNQDGECFYIHAKCTHMGCQLQWNPDELSWDCPCHGSRFDYKGNLINGPAMKGLFDE